MGHSFQNSSYFALQYNLHHAVINYGFAVLVRIDQCLRTGTVKRIQFKLLLDEARQTVYTFAQICVAAGNIDFVCAGEVIQHGRRSSTSIFSCSASQPG